MKYSIFVQDNNDEHYKQISFSNSCLTYEKESTIKINLTDRFRLFILSFLILTPQTNAMSISQTNSNQGIHSSYVRQSAPSFSTAQLRPRSMSSIYPSLHTYKIYRHFPILSYSNGVEIQTHNQIHAGNQKQLRRERYRRTMINNMFLLFDENVDGQLSKDELYSLSLRLNIFPRFHRFLKKKLSRI